MITKIYKSVDISKQIFIDLESKYDLDVLLHVENAIWNNSQSYILKDYLKRNQQMLFGTYLYKSLIKI
jgi:plasmid maintenance system antidote protein VapI